MRRFLSASSLIALVLLGGLCFTGEKLSAQSPPGPLQFAENDKIVIIGNTLAERMQYDGYFETLLQHRFPTQQLVVRNLGWSADEIDLRPRSANFDDHGHKLSDYRPDVVLAMFGFNESFAGPSGLEAFRDRFSKFLVETPQQAGSDPTLVVFSPIPHENLERATLPDGSATNENLRLYMGVMAEQCREQGVRFVDLFTPMKRAMEASEEPLTINGVHLNDRGNAELAKATDAALFDGGASVDFRELEPLRQAVLEKNRQHFYDYRAVNGYYIYGGRKNPYGVVNFPEEFAKLRKMIAVRDQRIWKIAQGQQVPPTIDDSGTGELSPIESNVADQPTYHTPEESRQLFDVADGFEIELVASEVGFPDLMNPVALDIDGRGRLWVTTTPTYPQYLPGTPVNDKVLIFEDTTGDGKADKQTVFADGLHLPIGLALADGGAYVSQQPNLMFLKDTDGDDVADEQKFMLHGFDSADSHHAISAFVMGPGGGLYMQEGTFHHTQVETPYGPERVKDAAVFRYEPTTERFSIFVSYNFANPWGHCFDRWGQNFVADASGGANYVAAAFSGDVIYPHKHRQMQQFLKKQWRPTCGCVIVGNSHFPESTQGNYLLNNTIGFLGTLQYQMNDAGSGFQAEPVDPLLSSRDTNFRPVALKFGPDGALYIVDWFNPLIGHMQHNLRDPKRDKHHGRIWRIRNKNKPLLEIPKIEGASTEELVKLLERYDDPVRELARRELRLHPSDEVEAAIDRWLAENPGDGEAAAHRPLEALWVMQHHDRVRPDLLERVLQSGDARARAAGTRVLSYWRERIEGSTEMLVNLAADPSPRVRLEAVRAASFYRDPDEGRRVVSAALTQPLDDYLNYTITETTTTLDRRGGSKAGSGSTLISRLAKGDVASGQLVQLTQLAVRDAEVTQLATIANAILRGPYEGDVAASALGEVLTIANTKRLRVPADVEAMIARYQVARREGNTALLVQIANSAKQWELEGLTAAMREVAIDPEAPGAAVDAALEAIVSFSTPSSSDFRGELLRSQHPSELRLRFARAIAAVSPGQAAQALGQALASGIATSESELLSTAADALLATDKGLEQIQASLGKSPPPADTAKLLLRSVYASGTSDGPLVEMLARAAGIGGSGKPLSEAERKALIRTIESEGDPHQGQLVYRRAELNCIQCHAISGAGGNVGPDLSGVGVNSPTEYLLDSLLEPSKQIKEAYLTLNVLTVDGQILRGVQVDRDDTRLVLRDEKGREILIPVADIEDESEGKSLMPEGQHHLLTDRELVDLVAFLAALGKPGDFVVNTQPTIQRYQYLADAKQAERLAGLPEGQLEAELDEIDASHWQSAYAVVDGTLPAEALANKPDLLVLRGEVEVVVPGPIGVRVSSDADVQLVINGKSVASNGEQHVELDRGRHRLYFVIEAPTKFTSMKAEVTKPAGAAVQFTVVGGI